MPPREWTGKSIQVEHHARRSQEAARHEGNTRSSARNLRSTARSGAYGAGGRPVETRCQEQAPQKNRDILAKCRSLPAASNSHRPAIRRRAATRISRSCNEPRRTAKSALHPPRGTHHARVHARQKALPHANARWPRHDARNRRPPLASSLRNARDANSSRTPRARQTSHSSRVGLMDAQTAPSNDDSIIAFSAARRFSSIGASRQRTDQQPVDHRRLLPCRFQIPQIGEAFFHVGLLRLEQLQVV